jgi:hypothetical protein
VKNQEQTLSIEAAARRQLFTFPAAILAIIIGKAFWTCRGRIVDTDLWWHLRNAKYMVSRHEFPVVDSYSFTAAGSPWIDHSWLSELVYYSGYSALGLQGVFVIFTLVVGSLGALMFFLCRKENPDPLAAGVSAIWGGLLAMVGFTPRAQNFGWLCFAAVYVILLRFRQQRRGPLWLIPVLFCLWINLHGGWPVGLAVFAIIFAAGCVHRDIGQLQARAWTPADMRKLLVTFGASVAALFINPFSWKLVLYPFDLAFNQKLNVTVIGEWAPVAFNDSRGLFVIITLFAVVALALLPRRPWRIDDVVLLGFALYCGLAHVRLLVITGIVLAPILARQLGAMSSYDPARERKFINASIMLAVALMMTIGFPAEEELDGQVRQFFPVAATDYLRTHPIEGNFFNQFEWGGYLEWALPEVLTFIDPRTDIFEYTGVLKDYLAISTFDRTEELFDHYDISYVMYPARTPLSYFLSKSPRWRCFYQDSQAIIYRRSDAGNSGDVSTCGTRAADSSTLP